MGLRPKHQAQKFWLRVHNSRDRLNTKKSDVKVTVAPTSHDFCLNMFVLLIWVGLNCSLIVLKGKILLPWPIKGIILQRWWDCTLDILENPILIFHLSSLLTNTHIGGAPQRPTAANKMQVKYSEGSDRRHLPEGLNIIIYILELGGLYWNVSWMLNLISCKEIIHDEQ